MSPHRLGDEYKGRDQDQGTLDDIRVEAGNVVVVEIHSLGLWALNLSQVVEVMRNRDGMGSIYKITAKIWSRAKRDFSSTSMSALVKCTTNSKAYRSRSIGLRGQVTRLHGPFQRKLHGNPIDVFGSLLQVGSDVLSAISFAISSKKSAGNELITYKT
jgi:hypothetical protein